MLILRKPKLGDDIEIMECYDRSAFIHQPWAYPPENYESYLTQEERYFLCLEATGEIVGTFHISGVVM